MKEDAQKLKRGDLVAYKWPENFLRGQTKYPKTGIVLEVRQNNLNEYIFTVQWLDEYVNKDYKAENLKLLASG